MSATTTALAMECGYAWGERPAYGGVIHHDCAEPEGHLDDHVCGTCGKSRPNPQPWNFADN